MGFHPDLSHRVLSSVEVLCYGTEDIAFPWGLFEAVFTHYTLLHLRMPLEEPFNVSFPRYSTPRSHSSISLDFHSKESDVIPRGHLHAIANTPLPRIFQDIINITNVTNMPFQGVCCLSTRQRYIYWTESLNGIANEASIQTEASLYLLVTVLLPSDLLVTFLLPSCLSDS